MHSQREWWHKQGTDQELNIERLKTRAPYMKHIPHALRNSKNAVRALVSVRGALVTSAAEWLKADRDVIVDAVLSKSPYSAALVRAPVDLLDDRHLIYDLAKRNGDILKYATKRLKKDKVIVLAAVSTSHRAIGFADIELKNDPEVVLRAIEHSHRSFYYAGKAMQSNRDIVLKVVAVSGCLLRHASLELRDDYEVVHKAARQCGEALRYASDRLKSSRSLALIAAESWGYILEEVSMNLLKDRELVLKAVSNAGVMFLSITGKLRCDRDVICAAVSNSSAVLEYVPKEFLKDQKVALAAVWRFGFNFKLLDEELRGDIKVVMTALQSSTDIRSKWNILQYATGSVFNNPCVAAVAIQHSPTAFKSGQHEAVALHNRLCKIIRELLHYHCAPAMFTSEVAVMEFAQQWMQCTIHVQATCVDAIGEESLGKMISEFAGAKREYYCAMEVMALSPVIAAFAKHNINWKHMTSSRYWPSSVKYRRPCEHVATSVN